MNAKTGLLVTILAAGLAASGCSAKKNVQSAADLEEQLKQRDQQIAALESSVQRTEADLKAQQREAEAKAKAAAKAEAAALEAERKAREAEAAARAATRTESGGKAVIPAGFEGAEMLPPNAKAGECYARVFVPPTYGTETVRVLKREASARVEIIPATYGTVEEKVLVQEASERIEVVPATYKWVEERVMVKEASSRMEEVPAVYDWVEERILVKPAHKVWKKGRGPIEKVDNATGEIMCLVEVPEQYNTVKKRLLKSPATTREVKIPAEYKTVKKQVVATPPSTRNVSIPAKYETVKVKKMTSPPREKRFEIPEEYATVTKTVQRTDGRMEWRPVLCETNVSADLVRTLQRALKNAKHDPGPIDGVYGRQTAAAVRSFQKANGLATGGLTLRTVEKLGINS